MKILITGATGLIGSEITKQLLEQKIPVHYLTTSSTKIKSNPMLMGFLWNPAKTEIDLRAFEGVTHIINLAGVTIAAPWTKAYKHEILESRISSIQTLKKGIESLSSHTISHFVGASAIGVYPNHLERLYTVHDQIDLDVSDSFLRQTVVAWESANLEMKELSIPVAQLRVGLVMDDKKGALAEFVKPIKMFVGASFGSGKQWQSWVHITDIAAMFIFLCQQHCEGIFNGVAPNPITQKELVVQLAKQLKKPLWLPNIPQFLMKLVLGQMSDLLFESQKVAANSMISQGYVFKYEGIEAALASFTSLK